MMVSLTAVTEHQHTVNGTNAQCFDYFKGTFHSSLAFQPLCSFLWFVNVWLNLFSADSVTSKSSRRITTHRSHHFQTNVFPYLQTNSNDFYALLRSIALSHTEIGRSTCVVFFFCFIHCVTCTYHHFGRNSIFSTVNTNTQHIDCKQKKKKCGFQLRIASTKAFDKSK